MNRRGSRRYAEGRGARAADGTYRMVWTTCCNERGFGHATSRDLVLPIPAADARRVLGRYTTRIGDSGELVRGTLGR